jgi:hypothetical protein
MTPEKLLDELVVFALEKKLLSTAKLPPVGHIILSQPDNNREILKNLTSNNLLNNRYPNR